MKKKPFETRAWPGYWEGTKPVVNFQTTSQRKKFSFLQREDSEYICVFRSDSGQEMIDFLDDSPFTDDKYYDSSGYYNWRIKSGHVLSLQSEIMRKFCEKV